MGFLWGGMLFGFCFLTYAEPVLAKGYEVIAGEEAVENGKRLSAVLGQLKDGDSVRITAGHFIGNFTIPAFAELYGGFADSAWDWKSRDFRATILDGNQTGSVILAGEELMTVYNRRGEKKTPISFAIVDGFMIQNGTGTLQDNLLRGGGLCGPRLWARHCTVIDNKADEGGGAYQVFLEECLVGNNTAKEEGGVFDCTVRFSAVVNNSAKVKPAGSSFYENSVVANNVATSIHSSYNTYQQCVNSIFWGNRPFQHESYQYTACALEMESREGGENFYRMQFEGGKERTKNILLGSDNNASDGPCFVRPTYFEGADPFRRDEILNSDWRNTALTPCVGKGIPFSESRLLGENEGLQNRIKMSNYLIVDDFWLPQIDIGLGCENESSRLPPKSPSLPPVIYVASYGVGNGFNADSPLSPKDLIKVMGYAAVNSPQTCFFFDAGRYEEFFTTFPGLKVYGGFNFSLGVTALTQKRNFSATILSAPPNTRAEGYYYSNTPAILNALENSQHQAPTVWDGFVITHADGSAVKGNGSSRGLLQVHNSMIVNCVTNQYQGIVRMAEFTHCIFANNTAGEFDRIFSYNGNKFNNTLFVNNISADNEDDMTIYPESFQNSVFWGNRNKNGGSLFWKFAYKKGNTHSAVEGGLLGDETSLSLSGENTDPNGPNFVKPTDFCGADPARMADILNADWHSVSDLFVDKGKNLKDPKKEVMTDLDGNLRYADPIQKQFGPDSARIDIGPYEKQP